MQGFAWAQYMPLRAVTQHICRHWQSLYFANACKCAEDSSKEQRFSGSVCKSWRGVVSNWRALWEVGSLCLCSLWCQERYVWCIWASVCYFLYQERWGEITPATSEQGLHKHRQRANYQAVVWKNSLRNNEVPTPVGKGWFLKTEAHGERLETNWMDGLPAPRAVIELTACTHKKSCDEITRDCILHGLKCSSWRNLKFSTKTMD